MKQNTKLRDHNVRLREKNSQLQHQNSELLEKNSNCEFALELMKKKVEKND